MVDNSEKLSQRHSDIYVNELKHPQKHNISKRRLRGVYLSSSWE